MGQDLSVIDYPHGAQELGHKLVNDPCLPAEVRLQEPPGLPRDTCRLYHSTCCAGHAELPQPPYQHFGRETVMEALEVCLPGLPEPLEVLHAT